MEDGGDRFEADPGILVSVDGERSPYGELCKKGALFSSCMPIKPLNQGTRLNKEYPWHLGEFSFLSVTQKDWPFFNLAEVLNIRVALHLLRGTSNGIFQVLFQGEVSHPHEVVPISTC